MSDGTSVDVDQKSPEGKRNLTAEQLRYVNWFRGLSREEKIQEGLRSSRKAHEEYYKSPEGMAFQKAHEEFKNQFAQWEKLFEAEVAKELAGISNPTKKEYHAALARAEKSADEKLPWRDIPLPL